MEGLGVSSLGLSQSLNSNLREAVPGQETSWARKLSPTHLSPQCPSLLTLVMASLVGVLVRAPPSCPLAMAASQYVTFTIIHTYLTRPDRCTHMHVGTPSHSHTLVHSYTHAYAPINPLPMHMFTYPLMCLQIHTHAHCQVTFAHTHTHTHAVCDTKSRAYLHSLAHSHKFTQSQTVTQTYSHRPGPAHLCVGWGEGSTGEAAEGSSSSPASHMALRDSLGSHPDRPARPTPYLPTCLRCLVKALECGQGAWRQTWGRGQGCLETQRGRQR
jgi:hypothetical protein